MRDRVAAPGAPFELMIDRAEWYRGQGTEHSRAGGRYHADHLGALHAGRPNGRAGSRVMSRGCQGGPTAIVAGRRNDGAPPRLSPTWQEIKGNYILDTLDSLRESCIIPAKETET